MINENSKVQELIEQIYRSGLTNEIELQAKTLKPLKELKDELRDLENKGYIRRKQSGKSKAFGDSIQLTQKGSSSVR
jgi:predicted transcriptional regulator